MTPYWRPKTLGTLVPILRWCLVAPSHYRDQCWLVISDFLRNFTWEQFHSKCTSCHSVHSCSTVMGFFKCIFDVSIIDILKRVFHMTFIGCFVIILWNFINLYLFLASRRPFKLIKVWKTRYQNACNWESFWWLFQCTQQTFIIIQIISAWDRNEARASK